jgi:hypothetical protein
MPEVDSASFMKNFLGGAARRCCLLDALRVRSGRGLISETKKPTLADELFCLMVEVGGIEPPSASTLQIVLHT